jgi:hypothetical protein
MRPTFPRLLPKTRIDMTQKASNPLLTSAPLYSTVQTLNTVRPKRYNPSTSERDRTPNHRDNASKTWEKRQKTPKKKLFFDQICFLK